MSKALWESRKIFIMITFSSVDRKMKSPWPEAGSVCRCSHKIIQEAGYLRGIPRISLELPLNHTRIHWRQKSDYYLTVQRPKWSRGGILLSQMCFILIKEGTELWSRQQHTNMMGTKVILLWKAENFLISTFNHEGETVKAFLWNATSVFGYSFSAGIWDKVQSDKCVA